MLMVLTGIPMIAIAAPFGVQNVVNYVIGMLIAVAVSFILTIIFLIKKVEKIIKEWSQS
ncbi:hypothetical protein BsIDN1_66830 [Bacillus safensis]|uniref:Uncharacterized protein n=1 Tax=Bacillus safensis TaxID=561879 RepID=A0A5S9MJV9_BACIA|nr:hypothetical protein BsIDN1_66830 [Bacillus safensis]